MRTERLALVPFVVGPLATNCYLLVCRDTGAAAIIDPGVGSEEELEAILREADRLGAEVRLIINTHGHPDHVSGNGPLKAETGAQVLIHEADAHMLIRPLWPWPGLRPLRPDRLLREGDVVQVGSLSLAVLHTPGHSPGSICLYERREGVLFTGDTLFAGSIGRTDLPGSSFEDMVRSLARLMDLPDRTAIWPGHGPPSSIGAERDRNPFVRMALEALRRGDEPAS